MDPLTIIATVGAVVFGGFWLMKRRARMRSGKFE
jgi:hypothetical protein